LQSRLLNRCPSLLKHVSLETFPIRERTWGFTKEFVFRLLKGGSFLD